MAASNRTGRFIMRFFLLIHLLLHATVNAEIRFRVPLWAVLIPFAALTAAKIHERLNFSKPKKPAADTAEII